MQFMADLVLECESCHGKRFKSDTLEVKFNDKSIYDVLEMTVNQAVEFFNEHGQKKIVKKLLPLQDVGLGYIKLGQALKATGLADSGIDAKEIIQQGLVLVNGEIDERRGRKLYDGDEVVFDDNKISIQK